MVAVDDGHAAAAPDARGGQSPRGAPDALIPLRPREAHAGVGDGLLVRALRCGAGDALTEKHLCQSLSGVMASGGSTSCWAASKHCSISAWTPGYRDAGCVPPMRRVPRCLRLRCGLRPLIPPVLDPSKVVLGPRL